MTFSTIADGERQLPTLRRTEVSSQLIVKGKPFLMLAAELHNSTFSKSAYMERVWPAMKEMNINTLLGAVTWENIEPEEGQFSFEELDKCILGARKHGFHIVILWFGAYKNARSTYAPAWVKKDVKRFPRIHTRQPDGKLKTVEVVQPYGKEIQQVSLRAFTKLMGHLRDFDADHSTVIMVQIENEIGLLFDSRDRSRLANQLYEQPVPADLLDHLKKNFNSLHPMFKKKYPSVKGLSAESPTWEQAFGPSPLTEDLFMADAFSRFIAPIAVAGRAEYDIPLYMNAALCSEEPDWKDFSGEIPEGTPEGNEPGQYPSGGPVGHNLDVYRFNAPGVDFYAPDIYLQDYEKICECFRHEGQPLFIPEQRRDEYGARRVWVAYGTYHALGCSPFGIDSLPSGVSPIAKHYKVLHNIRNHILDAQANRPHEMMGFFFDEVEEEKVERMWTKNFGDFEVVIERAFTFGKPTSAGGMVIRLRNGNFLVAGYGFQVIFKSTNPKSTFTGILSVKELEAGEDGNLYEGRILGGDETLHGEFITMAHETPDSGGFPIPFNMPAGTMMAECMPYSLEETVYDL